jgi:alkanesulfonate monooxygenase SsuD/methylene tetrahydromethanopterin reductase-like flavin-dependent oxidoreductase (luciferase family)
MYDPWVLLGAMALATSRVTLGAIVFAPTRRRPWKVAREATTIDHLSRGRLVLPVGLGTLDDHGFGNVGEQTDTRARAAILDETLTILDGLWSGEPFAHEGDHYRFGAMTFRPRPVQRPRIPVWVVVRWPSERSMSRALRWDGAILQTSDLGEVRSAIEHARARRAEAGRSEPFEVVVQGSTPPDPTAAGALVRPYAEAGATWWIDADWEHAAPAGVLARIAAGPPRVS